MLIHVSLMIPIVLWMLAAVAAAQDPVPTAEEPAAGSALQVEVTEAEQKFIDLLSGAKLVGSYSVDGRDRPPRAEQYSIQSVTKLPGDAWIVQSRMSYRDINVPIPVPVKVAWAGDTPMIQVTDLTIPLLGSGFTARVLFYDNRYAGTWAHGKVGGHMWGRIERTDESPNPATDKLTDQPSNQP